MHYRCDLEAIIEDVEDLLAMFTTFTGGWVSGWVDGVEVKNRANLSQVRFRLKLRLSLAIIYFYITIKEN